MLESLRKHFNSGATLSLESRIQALRSLENLIRENDQILAEAIFKDMQKPKQESLIGEIAVTLHEIAVARKNLKTWMKCKRHRTPFYLMPAVSRTYSEPKGVILIIGPWNYPLLLTLSPLAAALAAGNCCVIKPSDLTPNTSELLARLIAKYFSRDLVATVLGGVPETSKLLQSPFDHIFFTGSGTVGKIVMSAAANNLVPVTLELGGKSPAIVNDCADLELAARRIVWGKFYNAGQTCVAPDYVCVHKSRFNEFVKALIGEIQSQFGLEPIQSLSYARIINERHFERLKGLLSTERKNETSLGKIAHGGRFDSQEKFIEPTLLVNTSWAAPVMQEEIFGPILPILEFENIPELLRDLKNKPKPLAAYLFARSAEVQNQFVRDLSFGGGCINDVLVHLGNPFVPFGGIGESGMGNYHGHFGFLTFSHTKTVMRRTGFLDLAARYAPYDDKKLRFLSRLLGSR